MDECGTESGVEEVAGAGDPLSQLATWRDW